MECASLGGDRVSPPSPPLPSPLPPRLVDLELRPVAQFHRVAQSTVFENPNWTWCGPLRRGIEDTSLPRAEIPHCMEQGVRRGHSPHSTLGKGGSDWNAHPAVNPVAPHAPTKSARGPVGGKNQSGGGPESTKSMACRATSKRQLRCWAGPGQWSQSTP
jgi:hypothetical protein